MITVSACGAGGEIGFSGTNTDTMCVDCCGGGVDCVESDN